MQKNLEDRSNNPGCLVSIVKILAHTKVILICLILLILLAAATYLVINRKSIFGIDEVKTRTISMNQWNVFKQSKLTFGTIKGKVVGEYKVEPKVRIGNISFKPWFNIGTKSITLNDSVRVSIGYDFREGDSLFSNNAQGFLRETNDSLILKVSTDFPFPRVIERALDLDSFPQISNSIFTGKISSQEVRNYLDTVINETSSGVIELRYDFFRDAYAESVSGLLMQALQIMANGRVVHLEFVVNGTPYVPGPRLEKDVENIIFPVDKTRIVYVE